MGTSVRVLVCSRCVVVSCCQMLPEGMAGATQLQCSILRCECEVRACGRSLPRTGTTKQEGERLEVAAYCGCTQLALPGAPSTNGSARPTWLPLLVYQLVALDALRALGLARGKGSHTSALGAVCQLALRNREGAQVRRRVSRGDTTSTSSQHQSLAPPQSDSHPAASPWCTCPLRWGTCQWGCRAWSTCGRSRACWRRRRCSRGRRCTAQRRGGRRRWVCCSRACAVCS